MNYYEILGVKRDASQEEIKKTYKELIKKYHPDIYKGDKSFAERKTSEINNAYDTLSDKEKRKAYDEEIFPTTVTNYTYNQNYSNYNTSSYNSTRSKYNSYSSYSGTNDGSEHDYSTYVNYGGKGQTNYYRYNNRAYNYYDEKVRKKILNNVDKLSRKRKIQIFFLIAFVYLFFLLIFIMQFAALNNFYASSNMTSTSESPLNTVHSSTNNSSNGSSNKNSSSSKELTTDEILAEYFTESEIDSLYQEFLKESNSDVSYNEFKELLAKYMLYYYN